MKNAICSLAFLIALLCYTGCCKDPLFPPTPLPGAKASTPLTQIGVADTVIENGVACITREMKWGPHYSDVLSLNPQDDVVYPGAVFNYESFQDGTYQPIIGDRKPITFSTSLSGGGGPHKKTIEEPSLSAVREGIREILNPYDGATVAIMDFRGKEIYSKEHFALSIGGNLSSSNFDLSAKFDFSNTAIKSRYLIEFTQEYYSIDLDIPPAGMGNWFEKPLDNEEQLGNYSPVFVSSIRYGRKAFILIESETLSREQVAGLETSFGVFKTDVEIDVNSTMQKLVQEKSIKIAIMGGSAVIAAELITDINQLENFLEQGANFSKDSPGVPLAYTLRFIEDNTAADLRLYDEFTLRECLANSAEVAIPARLFLCPDHVGGDNEFNGNGPITQTKAAVELRNNDKEVWLTVTFHAREDGGDLTEAYSAWEWKIFTDPLGRTIAIESDNFTQYAHTDDSDDLHESAIFANTELIKKIEIMGDTSGSDLGFCGIDNTYLSLYFHPLRVTFK